MNTREEEIRALLRASREDSLAEIRAIEAEPMPDLEFVCSHIHRYVLKRFMLSEEEAAGADFDELADRSIAKSAGMSSELVRELDATRDCAGSTSSMAKKVLLFLNIQKQLHITLPAMETAEIQTLRQLGELVWRTLQQK